MPAPHLMPPAHAYLSPCSLPTFASLLSPSRQDTNMPAPRHGIFPVADKQGNIFVAGGGEKAGFGQSAVNSYFRP